ncbi:103_t:CDS:1 [Funneliformis geosporum]|uniref:9210_t:CDS:1 n=1 Tax=Funneliformis geosporum TaxID=1117311 RepID=A0A9W4SH43_9GLOM|nr:103_t:CDS:1 [Funneliformis geosporum]CAI2169251.1 9210_t:CDS:1 [Funneliformis geosporum]
MSNSQLNSNQVLLSAAGVDISRLNQGIINQSFLPASQTANTFPVATNMTLNQNLLPPQINSLSLPPQPNINQEISITPNQPTTTGTIFLPNGTMINQNLATAAANYAAYWQSMNLLDPLSNAAPNQIRPEVRQDIRSFHSNEFNEGNNHKDYSQNWSECGYPLNNREVCHGNQNFYKESNCQDNYHEQNWRDNHYKEQGWREDHDFDRDHVDPKLNRQNVKERNNCRYPSRPVIEYPLSRCLPSCEEIPDATARLTETIRLWWIDNEGTALKELEKLGLQPQLDLQQWRTIALNQYVNLELFVNIRNILQWLKAFTIYTEAVLTLYPHRREELDTYESHIVEKSDKYPFEIVFKYDQERRMQLCDNRQLTLLMSALETENRYFYPIVEHRTGFINLKKDRWDQIAYDERGKEICNKYNFERCNYPYCKRSHVCIVEKCGGLHPGRLCPTKKSGSNTKFGRRQNIMSRLGSNTSPNNNYFKGSKYVNKSRRNSFTQGNNQYNRATNFRGNGREIFDVNNDAEVDKCDQVREDIEVHKFLEQEMERIKENEIKKFKDKEDTDKVKRIDTENNNMTKLRIEQDKEIMTKTSDSKIEGEAMTKDDEKKEIKKEVVSTQEKIIT